MKTVTILIPAYNEEEVLPEFIQTLKEVTEALTDYQFEFLFINDGSTDGTTGLLEDYRMTDRRIEFVELSRNFGKEVAMLAGFDFASGDAVIIMDADLQHPPAMIKEFIDWWEQGYEDVFTVRKERTEESSLKRWGSKMYHALIQWLSPYQIPQGAGDFRLLDRKCVEAIKHMRENARNTKGMYGYIGFRKKAIEYEEAERAAGTTKWKFSQLAKLAIDGITSNSTVPLRVWSIIGLITSLLSFIFLFIEMFKALVFGSDVAGYPTLLAAVVFLGGIQLISLGAIGEYLARVFIETKNRPPYFVRKTSEGKMSGVEIERDLEHERKNH